MLNAEKLIDSIDRLPSLPAVYLRVRELIDDPHATLQQLADVVATDPPLAARTLSIVNSAYYAQPRRIETLSRALSVLGMRRTHDIALAASMATTFAGIRPAELDMSRFWRGSVYRAVAARRLAAVCGLLDVERLFIEGLLSDLGHLVMYLKVPQQALTARTAAQAGTETLAVAERRLIGCDYAQVGAALLARWRLPAAIEQVVRHHVDPRRGGERALEAAIVFVGAHLAGAALEELPLPVGNEIPAATLSLLKLPTGALTEVAKAAGADAADAAALLFPESAVA